MMKKYLLLLLLLPAIHATAQKIDPLLTSVMQQTQQAASRAKAQRANGNNNIFFPDTVAYKKKLNVSFNPDGTVRSFVVFAQFDAEATLPEGVSLMNRIGNTMILNVKAEALNTLGNMKEIKKVQASRTAQLLNEKARMATSSAYVTGELPGYGVPTYNFGHHYTGKNVVVGIVDSGIDFNHPAFRNPQTGLTRIKEAIHFENGNNPQMVTTTNPLKIGGLTTFSTTTSHGSHTSATAAGSPVKEVNAQGIAHEADLVLCDLGNTLYDDYLVAGVKEIFRYAESVNKPAVVNLSIGRSVDFHDGMDIVPYLFSQLTGEGKVLCISAGNDADVKLSVRKNGIIKTVLMPRYIVNENDKRFIYPNGLFLWAAATKDHNIKKLSLIVIDTTTGGYREIQQGDAIDANGNDITAKDPFIAYGVNERNHRGTATFEYPGTGIIMTKENTVLGAIVEAESDDQEIMFMDYFAGKSEDVIDGGLEGFSTGTNEGCLNTFTCTDKVLSVGSYVHSPRFVSLDGKTYYSASDPNEGSIAHYSSYGIDDNGKLRPDMVTPGHWTVSAYNIYDETSFDTSTRQPKIPNITNYADGINIGLYRRKLPYAYGAMTGTSMACPAATGIVALWLQADPTLSAEKIREMLQNGACLNDKWTTIADNLPSHDIIQAGYGKVDALRGIKMIENAKAGRTKYALDETIEIGNDGIIAYSSRKPLDFRSSSAPKAYIATDYNTDNETLTFSRSEQLVEKNTGLILKGEAGSYIVPIAAAGNTPEKNYLVSTATIPVTFTKAGTAFVLEGNDGKAEFNKNVAFQTIPMGKSYLKLPNSIQNASNISGFVQTNTGSDDIDEDKELLFTALHATGIEDVRINNDASQATFNLNGQRVGNSYRGMIINNGKKYANK